TAVGRFARIAHAGILGKTRAARVAVGSPPPSGRTGNTVALGGLMAPCGPPLRADRRLPYARLGIAALRPRTPIFLHFLLVFTAPQSARGVNYSGKSRPSRRTLEAGRSKWTAYWAKDRSASRSF